MITSHQAAYPGAGHRSRHVERVVDNIPDERLWAVRQEYAKWLEHWVKSKTVTDRLTRGDAMQYAMKAANTFDREVLTLDSHAGWQPTKRLHLLIQDPDRMLRLLAAAHPIQLLFAGKAHPRDDDAKRVLVSMFNSEVRPAPRRPGRLPRGLRHGLGKHSDERVRRLDQPAAAPPGSERHQRHQSRIHGVLNLSVLDGWWAEAYDGSNGWAIDGTEDANAASKDARDAAALYELLEREVIPLFYDARCRRHPRGLDRRASRHPCAA